MHSGPDNYQFSRRSRISIDAIGDLLIKVRGRYPGLPKVVNSPKLKFSSRISTLGILASTLNGILIIGAPLGQNEIFLIVNYLRINCYFFFAEESDFEWF